MSHEPVPGYPLLIRRSDSQANWPIVKKLLANVLHVPHETIAEAIENWPTSAGQTIPRRGIAVEAPVDYREPAAPHPLDWESDVTPRVFNVQSVVEWLNYCLQCLLPALEHARQQGDAARISPEISNCGDLVRDAYRCVSMLKQSGQGGLPPVPNETEVVTPFAACLELDKIWRWVIEHCKAIDISQDTSVEEVPSDQPQRTESPAGGRPRVSIEDKMTMLDELRLIRGSSLHWKP